jgi:hypothetical protein
VTDAVHALDSPAHRRCSTCMSAFVQCTGATIMHPSLLGDSAHPGQKLQLQTQTWRCLQGGATVSAHVAAAPLAPPQLHRAALEGAADNAPCNVESNTCFTCNLNVFG